MGLDKDLTKDNYEPGINIKGKVTVLSEDVEVTWEKRFLKNLI